MSIRPQVLNGIHACIHARKRSRFDCRIHSRIHCRIHSRIQSAIHWRIHFSIRSPIQSRIRPHVHLRSHAGIALASALALAAVLPSIAHAAKWAKVGDSGAVAVFVDKDSLRRASGGDVDAALEWRWVRSTDVPDSNGSRQYRLERQVQASNCSNHSYAVVEGVRYADERGVDVVSSYSYDEAALRWGDASSRTMRGGVVDYVCRNAPVPAAAPAQKPMR